MVNIGDMLLLVGRLLSISDIRGQGLFSACFKNRWFFSLWFKYSGHVILFLWLCGLQNTDHVMPLWLITPVTAKEKTAS